MKEKEIESRLMEIIKNGDLEAAQQFFNDEELKDNILQALLTTVYSDQKPELLYESDAIDEAYALLGTSLKNLNMLHICCLNGDEDLALEIIDFFLKMSEEFDSKKILLEFVGRTWGAGNTVLHLAAFMGMDRLAKLLIELGANTFKVNENKYKPVDCAAEDVTCSVFRSSEAALITRRSSYIPLEAFDFEAFQARRKDAVTLSLDHLSVSSTLAEDYGNNKGSRKASKGSVDSIPRTESKASILSNSQKKPKLKKSTISFDPKCNLIYLCQYGDEEGDSALLGRICSQLPSLDRIRTGHQLLTPLHIACAYNQIHIVKYFLQNCEIKVNVRDREGWTPLHSACFEENIEIINLLGKCQGRINHENGPRNKDWFYVIDGPIILDMRNEEDESPLDLAKGKENKSVINCIQDIINKFPPAKRPKFPEDDLDDEIDEEDSNTSETEDEEEQEENEEKEELDASVGRILSASFLSSFKKAESKNKLLPTETCEIVQTEYKSKNDMLPENSPAPVPVQRKSSVISETDELEMKPVPKDVLAFVERKTSLNSMTDKPSTEKKQLSELDSLQRKISLTKKKEAIIERRQASQLERKNTLEKEQSDKKTISEKPAVERKTTLEKEQTDKKIVSEKPAVERRNNLEKDQVDKKTIPEKPSLERRNTLEKKLSIEKEIIERRLSINKEKQKNIESLERKSSLSQQKNNQIIRKYSIERKESIPTTPQKQTQSKIPTPSKIKPISNESLNQQQSSISKPKSNENIIGTINKFKSGSFSSLVNADKPKSQSTLDEREKKVIIGSVRERVQQFSSGNN